MPDLKQLKVLRAVAEAGSFSAAADALDYTQPAVSRIVASLERELGAALIDRDVRPLRLTDAGRAIARRSAQIFDELATAEAEVQAITQLDGGRLRVGTFSSAGVAFVVPALCDFRRHHPLVEISIIEGWPRALVDRLRARELDLCIVFDFPDAGDDIGAGLWLEELLADPHDVVLPRDHRLADADAITFADLAREDWIQGDYGPDSPSLRLIGRACAAAGFEPRVALRVNDCQLTQSLVAAGEGIALLPRLMLRPLRSGVTVKPLAGDVPTRRIAVARLPSGFIAPAADRFITALRKAALRRPGRPGSATTGAR